MIAAQHADQFFREAPVFLTKVLSQLGQLFLPELPDAHTR